MTDEDMDHARQCMVDTLDDLKGLLTLIHRYLQRPSSDGSPLRRELRKELTEEVARLALAYGWKLEE